MGIANMKRVVIAAPQEFKELIIDKLKIAECIQIEDIKNEEEIKSYATDNCAENLPELQENYNKINFVCNFLHPYSKIKKGIFSKRDIISYNDLKSMDDNIDLEKSFEKCKGYENEISNLNNRKVKLKSLIDEYIPWKSLDIKKSDIDKLKKTSIYIGSINKRYESLFLNDLYENIKCYYALRISEKGQEVNYAVMSPESLNDKLLENLKKYSFSKTNISLEDTPSIMIENHRTEIESINKRLDDINNILIEEAIKLPKFQGAYDCINNKFDAENEFKKVMKTRKTILLKGWIPENKTETFKKSIEDNDFIFIKYFDEGEEEAPVLLKNNALNEPFEIITSMYSLPKKGEIDPTPVLTPFFMIFFGIMMADIGYGILLLLGGIIILKFMDVKDEVKKISKLMIYCSFTTMFFGWFFGGFFGDAIVVKPLWVSPMTNTISVLAFSIALGIIHIYTGLGVKAYMLIKAKKYIDVVFDVVFWYMFLTGLIVLLLINIKVLKSGTEIAKYTAIFGALGLWITQGRNNETITGKFFGGLYAVYGITSYLGDALSYSRLLALGLASGLIGSSFNLLIRLLGKGPAFFIAGPIIFVVGHIFNLLIGALGAFVHTCRLQYLEFFGKFYEGGGKPFNPIKISTKYYKVNSEK